MEDEDKIQMMDGQLPDKTERSPFVAEGGVLTTDDVIEELFRHRTWKSSRSDYTIYKS